MSNAVRSKAEEKFARAKAQQKQAVKERERVDRGISDKIARLRALRLAKEDSDRVAAKDAADRKASEALDKAASKAKGARTRAKSSAVVAATDQVSAAQPALDTAPTVPPDFV